MTYEPLIGMARMAKRMRHEMQCDPQWVLDLAAEREQIRAEVEALRKDAERYRWLRAAAVRDHGIATEKFDAEFDASLEAIDAAMAAKEGE